MVQEERGPAERRVAWLEWRNAQSFEDLCRLTERFLEGDLAAFPGWMAADIDEETDAWVEHLVCANRRGFLTTASQPGQCPALSHDGLPWSQRAFVVGFARHTLVAELREQVRGTRLVLVDFVATESGGQDMPAARHGPRDYLHVGSGQGPAELEIFRERIHPACAEALSKTRYICLIDPEWGQDDLLWPILANDSAGSEYK